MESKALPKLYVSYHMKDLEKVRELSYKLFDHVEVIDLQIGVGNRYYVENYYNEAVSTSSMMLVLVGNMWDKRQEQEFATAITMGK